MIIYYYITGSCKGLLKYGTYQRVNNHFKVIIETHRFITHLLSYKMISIFIIAVLSFVKTGTSTTSSSSTCVIENCDNKVNHKGEFLWSLDDCDITDNNIIEFIECIDEAGRDEIVSFDFESSLISFFRLGILSGMTSLETFSFDIGENISHIHLGLVENLDSLRTINVDATRGYLVPLGGLNSETHIEIDFSDEAYRDEYVIPSDLFKGLSKVKSLDISRENIDVLSEGIFDDMVNLISLDIHHNDIRHLPSGIFDNLVSLEFLDLSYNEIIDLEFDVFSKMENLLELNIEDNFLACYPDSFAREITVDDDIDLCVGDEEEHGLTKDNKEDEDEDGIFGESSYDDDGSEDEDGIFDESSGGVSIFSGKSVIGFYFCVFLFVSKNF